MSHFHEGWDNLVDSTKKVFINVTCYQDNATAKNVVTTVKKIGFSENKIFKGLDWNLVVNGDYNVRRRRGEDFIFLIETNGKNINFKQIGKL